jgi:hypothetical protein
VPSTGPCQHRRPEALPRLHTPATCTCAVQHRSCSSCCCRGCHLPQLSVGVFSASQVALKLPALPLPHAAAVVPMLCDHPADKGSVGKLIF